MNLHVNQRSYGLMKDENFTTTLRKICETVMML